MTTTSVLMLADQYADPTDMPDQLGGSITDNNTLVPVTYPNSVSLWPTFDQQGGKISWTQLMSDYLVANVNAGATDLDNAIANHAGTKIVFGHGMGAIVATAWLTSKGPTSTVNPTDLSFVLIGNMARKYGGLFADSFGPIPAGNRYTCQDLTRQYDGYSDFPGDPNHVTKWTAAANAWSGMNSLHADYTTQRLDDPNLQSFAENNIVYLWSMTYPVPLLGDIAWAQQDQQLRSIIEAAYSRPVTIPMPDYRQLQSWLPEPGPVPVVLPPKLGWWAEIHATFALGLTPTLGLAVLSLSTDLALALTPTLGVTGVGTSIAAFTLALTPVLGVAGAGTSHAGFGLALTPALGMTGAEHYARTFGLTLTPALTVTGAERYARTFTLTLTPQIGMPGAQGTSIAAFTLALTPVLGVAAGGTSHVTVALALTPALAVGGVERYAAAFALALTPALVMFSVEHYVRALTLALTPVLSISGAEHYARAFTLAATPALGMAGGEHYTAGFTLVATPALDMGAAHRIATVELALTPALAMTGAERYARDFTLAATPGLGMAGTGRSATHAGFTLALTPTLGMAAVATSGHDSVTQYFSSGGHFVLPAWFRSETDYVDSVAVQGGGSGAGQCFGAVGGGQGGAWAAGTMQVNFGMYDSTIGVSVGAGGASVSTCTNGNAGGVSSSYLLINGGRSTVTIVDASAAGAGGSGSASGTATYGQSPGNYTYLGVTYTGGAAAPSGAGSPAPAGNAPGGGGAGGTTSGQHGGPGGNGGVWMIARPNPNVLF